MSGANGVRSARKWAACMTGTLALTAVTGCQAISMGRTSAVGRYSVAEVAGWTRTVQTESYLMVVNVLPAEVMYTDEELKSEQPTEGELIVSGEGHAVGRDVRHVEVHLYNRLSGDVLVDPVPTLRVHNRTTGERVEVSPVLMQDIHIGVPDRHFGDNVRVRGKSDISVEVQVGTERMTVDGYLD